MRMENINYGILILNNKYTKDSPNGESFFKFSYRKTYYLD